MHSLCHVLCEFMSVKSLELAICNVLIIYCRVLELTVWSLCVRAYVCVCVCVSGSRGMRRLQKTSSISLTCRDTMQRLLLFIWTGAASLSLTLFTSSQSSLLDWVILVSSHCGYVTALLAGVNFSFDCTHVILLISVMSLYIQRYYDCFWREDESDQMEGKKLIYHFD